MNVSPFMYLFCFEKMTYSEAAQFEILSQWIIVTDILQSSTVYRLGNVEAGEGIT